MSRADGPRPRGSNYHGVTTQPSLEARSFYGRGKRNANNSVAGPCVLRLRVYSITLAALRFRLFSGLRPCSDFRVILYTLCAVLGNTARKAYSYTTGRYTVTWRTVPARACVSPVRRDTRADGSIAPCPLTALCIVWSQCGDCRGLCGLVYVHRTRESSQPIL